MDKAQGWSEPLAASARWPAGQRWHVSRAASCLRPLHSVHFVLAAAIGLALVVAAEDIYPSSLTLSVSAVVLKKVWLRVQPPPPLLRVTEEDVATGYIDLPAPTVLTLRSNSRDGFLFRIDVDRQLVASARMHGLARDMELAPGGASVPVAGRFGDEVRFELRWRLTLAEGVRPGVYAWPVRLQVDPM
jgi:hypothetical protein